MKIDFLRNFIKLTQYKSFSELAKDLSISQSTLSHQISQLEDEFSGVELIERTTRSFEITKAGKIFLDYAKKIVSLYDSCRQEISELNEEHIENIVITSSTIPGEYILPKFITNFNNKYSNVNFQILINNSKRSIDLLVKKFANFAGIGSFMDYNKDDFEYIKIGEDNLKFICSPNHELIKSENVNVNFDNLTKFSLIMREIGSGTRNIIEEQFSEYKLLKSQLEINDNDSIISAVSGSDNVSILSSFIAERAEKAGLIKILEIKEYPIIAKRDLFFIKRKEKKLIGLQKKFWEYLIK